MQEPELSLEQAKETIAAEAKAPRVTEQSIKDKIASVHYHWHGQLCICIITMANGFMQIGKSAPASPENFNPSVGERYAFEDAFKPLWAFEGYLLRERLANDGGPASPVGYMPDPIRDLLSDPKGVDIDDRSSRPGYATYRSPPTDGA